LILTISFAGFGNIAMLLRKSAIAVFELVQIITS